MCGMNVITGTKSEFNSIQTWLDKLNILDYDYQSSKPKFLGSYFEVPALDRVLIVPIDMTSSTLLSESAS